MHDCQKFREDWVADSAEEFGDCEECRSFCEEAQVILQATAGENQPVPELSEYYWKRFESRLHENLVVEQRSRASQVYWRWSAAVAAAAAIVVAVTWGGFRLTQPTEVERAKDTPQIEFVDDHIQGLNPSVVAFLEQSELFLRNFANIDPTYAEDLRDAQDQAKQGLEEIARQKSRAADFVPVRMALDEYENVLREIKNLESTDDLAELQQRVRRDGLIANLNAYQPQVVLVGRR